MLLIQLNHWLFLFLMSLLENRNIFYHLFFLHLKFSCNHTELLLETGLNVFFLVVHFINYLWALIFNLIGNIIDIILNFIISKTYLFILLLDCLVYLLTYDSKSINQPCSINKFILYCILYWLNFWHCINGWFHLTVQELGYGQFNYLTRWCNNVNGGIICV